MKINFCEIQVQISISDGGNPNPHSETSDNQWTTLTRHSPTSDSAPVLQRR